MFNFFSFAHDSTLNTTQKKTLGELLLLFYYIAERKFQTQIFPSEHLVMGLQMSIKKCALGTHQPHEHRHVCSWGPLYPTL